jgi:hypothetical protein
MPLKVTYEERIEDAVKIAKTSKGSPGSTLVAILRALGSDFGDGARLDVIWAEYYESHALAEVARLTKENADLQRQIDDHEPKF